MIKLYLFKCPKSRFVDSWLKFNWSILVQLIYHRFCNFNQTFLYYVLYVAGNVAGNVVGNDESGLKMKLKYPTVGIQNKRSELKTLECDILNPDRIIRLINLEIKLMRKTSNI